MKVMLTHQSEQFQLMINSTNTTKYALQHQQLSARERQLLLLIDKDDSLSAQAVAKLLNKVDLDTLVSRGLLTYEKKHTAKNTSHTAETQPTTIAKAGNFKGVKLQGFMKTYAAEESAKNQITTLPLGTSSDAIVVDKAKTQAAHQPNPLTMNHDKYALHQEVLHEFEDIMIAQCLLDF